MTRDHVKIMVILTLAVGAALAMMILGVALPVKTLLRGRHA